jgi:hypothetical protein
MNNQEKKYIGQDRNDKPLYIGDTVSIEQCWEDQTGAYHDETGVTISGVNPDGTLRFRLGDWHTRKTKDQQLQAFLNSTEWYSKDVEKEYSSENTTV